MIHGVLVLVNFMKNNNLAINIFFAIAIALSTILVGKLKPQEKQAIAMRSEGIAEPVSQSEVVKKEELPASVSKQDRLLKMSISVDNQSFLKVKLNDEIKKGDVISDNSNERQRLDRQKKAIKLQIDNLNSKTLIAPTPPQPIPLLKNLPPSAFEEEKAHISQAELKLRQARLVLSSRSKLLKTDNPERRAEFEKAGASVLILTDKLGIYFIQKVCKN
jgi:hypothetical protein